MHPGTHAAYNFVLGIRSTVVAALHVVVSDLRAPKARHTCRVENEPRISTQVFLRGMDRFDALSLARS